jgi:hypothetical protein
MIAVYRAAPGATVTPNVPNRIEVTYQLETAFENPPNRAMEFCTASASGRLTLAGLFIGMIGTPPNQTPGCQPFPFNSINLPFYSSDTDERLVAGRWLFFATYTMPTPSAGSGGCRGVAVGSPPTDAVLQDVVCRHIQGQ